MLQINKYMNINQIEFTVTNACTSRCNHCSVGNVSNEIKTSIDKNAAVNVYRDSITEIVNRYNPYENPMMSRLIRGGVCELIKFAEEYGITVDTAQFYSACRDIVKRLGPAK